MLSKEKIKKSLNDLVEMSCIRSYTSNESYKILLQFINEHFEPQPYKFDELKDGMWVYDDIYEDCVLISRICGEKEFECGNICEYRCFTDGRFYPVWMANVRCE